MSDTYFGQSAFFRNNLIELQWRTPTCTHFEFRAKSYGFIVIQLWWLSIAINKRLPFEFAICDMDANQLVIQTPFKDPNSRVMGFDGKPSKRSFYIDMPWMLKHHKTEVLIGHLHHGRVDPKVTHLNGTWVTLPNQLPCYTEGLASTWKFPFTYTDEPTGRTDEVIATVKGTRRTWRRKWLPFTNLFSFQRPSLDIEFSDEVGPNKGSYKGGLMGSSCDMLPHESVEQTLRRFERNLKIKQR